MRTAGIDIGSRTVKLAVVEDGQLIVAKKAENSFNPLDVCKRLLDGVAYDSITATGYGRHLFGNEFGCETITEIKAFAQGIQRVYPDARTILDIGGQDIKAIALDANGKMKKFLLNDKCAAGTGRFLEIMAMALGSKLEDFADMALSAERVENINSMCTVFAESEVISSLGRGAKREDVALGLHQSVASRTVSMLRRVGIEDAVVFVGGVAYNKCVRKLIEQTLDRPVFVPDDPQIIGAFGAARI
ncbi:MAG: acyl-CoA dehydratase activase [Candidatus Zixiibacteriota bacterium]